MDETTPIHDLNFINDLMYHLNKEVISIFNRLIDYYLMTPGQKIVEFSENEIRNNRYYHISLIDDSQSFIKQSFLKLNYGEKIFEFFKGKFTIIYQMIFIILTGFEYKNHSNWESEKQILFKNFQKDWGDHNKNFNKNLKETFKENKFIQNSFEDNDINEREQIYNFIDNNDIGYHFKLGNIFDIEEEIIFSSFNTIIQYHLNNKSTYFNIIQEIQYEKYDVEYNMDKEEIYQLEDCGFFKVLNTHHHNNNNEKEYYINIQMKLESKRYQLKKNYQTLINLILLPFFLRLHYSQFYGNTIIDNRIMDKPFLKNNVFSPYATKPLKRLSKLKKSLSHYELIDNNETINFKNYSNEEIFQSIKYRQLLSFMSFIIENIFNFNEIHFIIFDHIEESISKTTLSRLENSNLKINDKKNIMTLFIFKLLHKSLYFKCGEIFDLNSLDHYNFNIIIDENFENELTKFQLRDEELRISIKQDYDSKLHEPTFIFSEISETHILFEKLLLNNNDFQLIIDETNQNNQNIFNFLKKTYPNIYNKYPQIQPDMKKIQYQDIIDKKNLLDPSKFLIYEKNLFLYSQEILYHRSLLLLELIYFLNQNYDEKKKLFLFSVRKDLQKYWSIYQKFISLIFTPFLMNIILYDKIEQQLVPPTEKKFTL